MNEEAVDVATISWPAPEGTIPARIKESVLANTAEGGIIEMRRGKESFVRPGTVKNASGSQCYVWLEHWWDGMGGTGWDRYFVPAFAVEILQQRDTSP